MVFKAAIIFIALLLGIKGIGYTEKVLVIETVVSLYLVNRVI